MDDLDDLLAPVEARFGEVKREQVANVLRLGAQLAMKQGLIRKTKDPELRGELAAQITEAKRDLKQQRDEVGMYVMSYVRSIVPKTTWSLWARLQQILAKLPAVQLNLWEVAATRLSTHSPMRGGMHEMILSRLAAQAQAAAIVADDEE